MCNDNQTIQIVRGTTNSYGVDIKDKWTGEPYVLEEGEFLRFGVKASPTDDDCIFEKDFTDVDEDGRYTFTIEPDDTINLAFGSYWYDIGLQSGPDYYDVIKASPFEISYNITKREA